MCCHKSYEIKKNSDIDIKFEKLDKSKRGNRVSTEQSDIEKAEYKGHINKEFLEINQSKENESKALNNEAQIFRNKRLIEIVLKNNDLTLKVNN